MMGPVRVGHCANDDRPATAASSNMSKTDDESPEKTNSTMAAAPFGDGEMGLQISNSSDTLESLTAYFEKAAENETTLDLILALINTSAALENLEGLNSTFPLDGVVNSGDREHQALIANDTLAVADPSVPISPTTESPLPPESGLVEVMETGGKNNSSQTPLPAPMEEASTEARINITGVESTALIDLPSELNITDTDLKRLYDHLKRQLQKVENALGILKPQRRFHPVSASIPSDFSSMLTGRGSGGSKAHGAKTHPMLEECQHFSQRELVNELKQKGTYNPDLMAWDASGIFRFLDRSIIDQYEVRSEKSSKQAVQRNVMALERLLSELNLHCDIRTPEVISRISNLTITDSRRSVISPSLRLSDTEVRTKRHHIAEELLVSRRHNATSRGNYSRRLHDDYATMAKKKSLIGEVHVVPFGCDKRGAEEDGYLRLCSACQAIRKLPDTFFPPFINEVVCDQDKACFYFYDFPHGKCKQKHMNFVVLKNVGTQQCQIWQKYNLNVRVSCECWIDEMSFFAKYV